MATTAKRSSYEVPLAVGTHFEIMHTRGMLMLSDLIDILRATHFGATNLLIHFKRKGRWEISTALLNPTACGSR
jgi:hypothetical protein